MMHMLRKSAAMADERAIKRVKLNGVKSYGTEPAEVELPKDFRILEGGWLEGTFQVWLDVPSTTETETVKLRLLEDGQTYDPDEFEIVSCGIRTNAKPVALLKAK